MESAPLALTAAAGVLIGGPAVGLPATVAVLFAAAVAGLLHSAWIARLAVEVFRSGGRRGAAFSLAALGAGLLAAAGCAAAVPVAPVLGPFAGAAMITGLLWLPGVTASPGTRSALRRGLDGVCVALWKFLTLLVLILDLHGSPSNRVFGTCLLGIVGLSIAVVSGVRAPFPRWAAVTAAAGVAATVLGLAVLSLLPTAGRARDDWLLSAGGLLVLGSVLVWAGACRSVPAQDTWPQPLIADGTLIGDPLLVAPVLTGTAAVIYTVASRGTIGTAAMTVGVIAVVAVGLRELLETLTVRRFSGQLAVQEATFRSLVAGSTDVIIVLDRDLSVRWQSPAAARQFGLSDQEVNGRQLTCMVHPDDQAEVRGQLDDLLAGSGSARLVRARVGDGFGVWRPAEFTVSDLRGTPEVEGLVVHLRDVSERHQLEHALARTGRLDPLTGLANRAAVLRELASLPSGFLLTIGLDGFSGINDVHGPDLGDAMLVEVAARIRGSINRGDLAGRLNGDEFAVFTRVDKVHAYTLATRLLGELSEPFRLPGAVLQLSAGIGLAPAGAPEDTIRRAGLALRRAKRTGRGRVEWHDDAVEEAFVRRGMLEQHLPRSISRGELDLAYHPVYDLVEGHPVGVEALLRWRHPLLGTVPPRETLAVARELGMTAELHNWVLNRACRQLSSWQHEGYRLWMSVNVAFDDLLAPDFASRLSLALDSHQVDPADLVIELAERELGVDVDRATNPLLAVREIGVRTALDGFGTGATSLAHLRQLPADMLKVDQSLFVAQSGASGQIAPIIDVVVKLGHRLNVTVVAHGLEVERHLEVVLSAGCRYGQGHLYGQPAPAERVEAELVRQRAL